MIEPRVVPFGRNGTAKWQFKKIENHQRIAMTVNTFQLKPVNSF